MSNNTDVPKSWKYLIIGSGIGAVFMILSQIVIKEVNLWQEMRHKTIGTDSVQEASSHQSQDQISDRIKAALVPIGKWKQEVGHLFRKNDVWHFKKFKLSISGERPIVEGRLKISILASGCTAVDYVIGDHLRPKHMDGSPFVGNSVMTLTNEMKANPGFSQVLEIDSPDPGVVSHCFLTVVTFGKDANDTAVSALIMSKLGTISLQSSNAEWAN